MAAKKGPKPITRAFRAIDLMLKNKRSAAAAIKRGRPKYREVSVRTLQKWRQWCDAPDARGRQDGSRLSKQKRARR
jgi:hypothetical protein